MTGVDNEWTPSSLSDELKPYQPLPHHQMYYVIDAS